METEFYNKIGNPILGISLDPSSDMYIKKIITPNSQCNVIVSPYMYSMNAGFFGVKWYIKQLYIYPIE